MKNTRIKWADHSDQERWDQYVLEHPRGIAYQMFAWKEAVEQAYGFKGFYLIAQNNNQITGILPFIHVKLSFLPGNLISLPYCDAGGPLADSPEIERKLVLTALKFSGKNGLSPLVVRSIQNFADINPDLTVNRVKARMLLNLPDDSEKLLASLKAKVRSQVKKPVRDGLTIQTGGQELLHDFYRLFSENMRDLGSPVHSKKWFKNILKAYKNRGHLFLVRMPDKTPAAGGILLCHPNTVAVPWASSLRRFNRSNPNMLLYWSFLKFASDNGYKKFDFGRSTPGEGTFRFKKQWGATPAFLHWTEFKTGRNVTSDLLPIESDAAMNLMDARRIVEILIKKTPVSMANAFGKITRKYISL